MTPAAYVIVVGSNSAHYKSMDDDGDEGCC